MTLHLDSNLLSTKDASALSGYNADYLSRLCRSGKIAGTQIGRTWLVNRESLESFVRDQEERKQQISADLSQTREKEYQQAQKKAPARAAAARSVKPVVSPFTSLVRTPAFALVLSIMIMGTSAYAATFGPVANVMQNAGALASAAQQAVTGSSSANEPRLRIASNVANPSRNVIPVARAQSARPLAPTIDGAAIAKQLARIDVPDARAETDGYRILAYDAAASNAAALQTSRAQTERAFGRFMASDEPISARIIYAVVGFGFAERDVVATILDSYSISLNRAGETSLAIAANTRDAVTRSPELSAALLDTYAGAMYGWVDGSQSMVERTADAEIAAGPVALAFADGTQQQAHAFALAAQSAVDGSLSATHSAAALAFDAVPDVAGGAAAVAGAVPQALPQQLAATEPTAEPSDILASAASFPLFNGSIFLKEGRRVAFATYKAIHGLTDGAHVAYARIAAYFSGTSRLAVVPLPPAIRIPGEPSRAPQNGQAPADGSSYAYAGTTTRITNITNYITGSSTGVTKDMLDRAIDAATQSLAGNSGGTTVVQSSGGGSFTGGALSATTGNFSGDVSIGGNLALAGTLASGGAISAPFFTATSLAATSSFPNIISNSFSIGGDTITDFAGTGLAVVNGVLTATGGVTNAFVQGGNTFGAPATLGTADANPLSFITGNVARMTIDAAGSVGIGTTTSASLLSVGGDARANTFTAVGAGTSTLPRLVTNALALGNDYVTGFTGNGLAIIGGALGLDTNNNYFSTTSTNFWFGTKTTSNLAEGANLYFTNARADARINATSTIGTLTSAPNLGTLATSLNGIIKATSGVLSSAVAGTDYEVPLTFSSPLSRIGNTISIPQATGSQNGYLSLGDFNIFNNKISSSSLSAGYPLTYNPATGVFATAFSTTTANTYSAFNTFNGGVAIGALNGPLQANNGVVSATSSIGVLYGGTGLAVAPAYGQILVGNTAGGYTLAATSTLGLETALTFSAPLSRIGNTISIPQATGSTNGYLASADWTLFNNKISSTSLSAGTGISYSSVTGVIANTGLLSFAQSSGSPQAGAITLATSTLIVNGQTHGIAITNSAGTFTFTPTLSGILSPAGGGTGTSSIPTFGQILVGNGTNYTLTATSSLGLETALTFTSPLSRTGNAISIPAANGSTNGYLASGDWTLFNNKISSTSLSAGTGISYNSTTGVIANTGVTSVNASGGTTGLTFTGGPITTTGSLTLSGTLAQANGGTGIASYTAGDILYADNTGTLTRLPVGGNGSVLKVQAGLPSWGVDATVGGGGSDGIFATSSGKIYPLDTSNVVLVGTNATSTTNSIFEVNGQAYISSKLSIATTTAPTTLSVGGSGYFTGGLGVGILNTVAGTLKTSSDATIGGALAVTGATTLANATSTSFYTTTFGIGSSYFTSLLGSGLLNTGGVLTLDTSGNWSGTFGGHSSAFYLDATNLTNFGTPFYSFFHATTTDALAEGTANLYFTNARADARINATSTIGTLTSAPNLGTVNTALTGLLKATSGVLSSAVAGTDYSAALAFTYPLVNTANTISIAFGTTTSNTWAGTQTFTNSPTFSTLGAGAVNSTSAGKIYNTATSTPTLASEFTYGGTLGQFIGGTSGALSLTTNGTALSKLVQIGANTILGNNTGASGNVVAFATSTLGIALSDTTGTLSVARGGTGSTTLTGILKGAGTGSVVTALAGTDYEVPLTFSTGLNRSVNTITNTGVLAVGPTGQTTNGTAIFATSTTGTDFTITGSGSTITFNLPSASASNRGLLTAADWSTFNNKISSTSLSAGTGISYSSVTGVIANTGLLSLQQLGGGTAQAGAITFATTSATLNGQTYGLNITNAAGAFTFAPTLSGTLNVAGGGTGLTTVADGALVYGSGGTTLSTLATSTSGKILQLDFTTGRPSWVATSTLGLLSAAIQSIGPAGQLQTGPTVTLATSTSATTGLTTGITITGSGNVLTYAPTLSGTLNVANGGTGSTTLTGILKGNGTSGVLTAVAGTDYEVPLTFSTGLNRSVNTITNTGVLAVGPTGQTTNGTAIFATSTTGTNFTITGAGSTITFNLPTASAANRGALSSADWTLFSNKISSTSLSAVYPLAYNSSTGVFTTAFSTTTTNVFSALNTFNGGLSASTINTTGSITTGTQFLGVGSDGSGVPSFSWGSDLQTGIFHGGVNVIGFATGGIERARIDSSGFFGIGTSSASASLSVEGNALIHGTLTVDGLGSGVLHSSNGLVSASNVNLATEVTGILGIANGGTATSTQVTNGVNYFDGTRITSNANFTFDGANGQLSVPSNGWYSIGGSLLAYASSTNESTIFGLGAGGDATTSSAHFSFNTAIGYQALSSNAATSFTGYQNTAIGAQALQFNVSGTNNTAVGYHALNKNAGGSNNGFGYAALSNNVAGGGNNAFGSQSLSQLNGGSYNVAFGDSAGGALTTGSQNVFIGSISGTASTITSGSNNIGIGFNTLFQSATADNQLNIGGFIYGNLPATTTVFKLPTSGALGIGSSSPFAKLSIQTNNGDTATSLFAIGSSTASATTTLFSVNNTGSTTIANGVNITAGCYAINGTCLSLSSFAGTLAVANGGTGSTTLSGILVGNGTSAVKTLVVGSGLTFDGTTLATSGTGITSIGPAGQLQTGGTQTLATSTTGSDFTITASSNTITFNLPTASASNRGALSSADWTTFNNKISSTSLSAGTGISYSSVTGVIANTGVTSNVAGTGISVSGATGAVTISNNGVLSLQQLGGGTAQAGALTFATSSVTNNGVTIGLNITNTAGAFTFTPTRSGTLTVAGGGTGLTSLADGALAYGSGGTTLSTLATSTAGKILQLDFTTGRPSWVATSTLGLITAAIQSIGPAGQLQSGPNVTFATSTSATTGLTAGITITGSGNTITYAPTLSGTLNAANGGTGSTTLSGILVGNGTSAVNTLTLPSFLSLSGSTLSLNGALGIANGGTGTTTQITNGVNYFDGTRITSNSSFTFDGSNLSIPSNGWYAMGGSLLAYSSSTQNSAIFGIGAGGQSATTTGGSNITAIGSMALSKNTGAFNTAIGASALRVNTSGGSNTALGYSVLSNNTTGSSNVGIGMFALNALQSGVGNTTIGNSAMASNLTGSYNVAIGYQAGPSGAGYGNTIIGSDPDSAGNVGAGFNNIGIGYGAAFATAGGSNQLSIGGLLYGTLPATTTAFKLPTSGALGVGTSSPFAKLSIQTNAGDTATTLFAVGSSTASATTTLFSISNTGAITQLGGASSTLSNGINITAGCFAVNGACISAGTPFSNTLAGGGTATTTFYNGGVVYSDGSKLTQATGSGASIFTWDNTNGRLGIGTSTPGSALSVAGNSYTSGFINTSGTTGGYQIDNQLFGYASSTNGVTILGLGAGGQNATTSPTSSGTTALGYQALTALVGGLGNTAVGYQSLQNATSSGNNTALGFQALIGSATGFSAGGNNTAVGNQALRNLSTGNSNTSLGYQAAGGLAAGSNNVALGVFAAYGNGGGFAYTASRYVAVGFGAGRNLATGGDDNTFLGYNSGSNVGAGYGNVLVGASPTANNLTTGAGNIGIGDNTFFPDGTANSQLNIGGLLYGTLPATTTAFTLPRSGALGVGTSSPFAKLSIQTNAGDTATALFAIGSSTASATTTLFSISNTGAITQLGGASSTLSNGINITAGCYAVNGSCIGSGSFSNTLASGGTATTTFYNKGVVYSDGSKLTQASGSGASIFNWDNTNGRLGIGTSTPYAALSVAGSAAFTGLADFYSNVQLRNNSDPTKYLVLEATTTNSGNDSALALTTIHAGSPVTNFKFGSEPGGGYDLIWPGGVTPGASNFIIEANHTNGDNWFNADSRLYLDIGDSATVPVSIRSGNVGINYNYNVTPNGTFNVRGSDTTTGIGFQLADSNQSPLVTELNYGSVGIGTTSPYAKLSVHGNPNDNTVFTTLFAVGSSTASATTTLFSISNTGALVSNSTATSTFAAGLNITAGCFAVNGTCVGSGSAGVTSLAQSFGSAQTGALTLATTSVTVNGQTHGLNITNTGGTFTFAPTLSGTLTVAGGGTGTTTQITNGINYFDGTRITSSANFTFGGANGQLSIPTNGWLSSGGNLFAYASSTNNTTIFGLGAGGQAATTTGVIVTAFGTNALAADTTGNSNVAVGPNALQRTTTGSANIGVGGSSLNFNTTGSFNNAIGSQAIIQNTTGSNNNAFGSNALGLVNTGSYNIGIGDTAGYSITSGAQNILIGAYPDFGTSITTGSNNIGIGYEIKFPDATANNQLSIGGLIYGNLPATTTAFKYPTTGALGIGSTSPYAKLSIHTNAGDTATTLFAIGSSTASATTTLFSISNTGALVSNSTATSTFAAGLNITSGCFAVNGACISAGTPFSNTLGGGGTATTTFYNGGVVFSDGSKLTQAPNSGTNIFNWDNTNGRLGIGTSTPGSLLSVGNTNGINFSTATSTFSSTGGINLAAGCFAVNGVCISAGTPFSNTLAGGGTATTTFYNGGVVFSDGSKLTQSAAAANFFWDETNKRLGLGTSTPGSLLSLQGIANFTTATSTFQSTGGINLTAGCFAVNGTCVGSGSGSGTVGSGTTGQFPYYAGSGTTLTATSTLFLTTSGAIGIGTTTPTAVFALQAPAGNTGQIFDFANSSGATLLHLSNAGNLGIGTSTPGSLLSLQGIANFTTATSTFYGTGGINIAAGCFAVNGTCVGSSGGSGTVGSGTTGQFPYYAANGTTLTATSSIFVGTNGRVGIGTTTPWAAFSVNPTAGSVGTGAAFVVGSSTATSFYVGNDGRVGFGTTNTLSPFQFLGPSNTSPNFSVADFKSTTGDVNLTFTSLGGNTAFIGQRNSGPAYFTAPNGFSIDKYSNVTSMIFANNDGTFCAGGIFANSTCSGAAIFVTPTTLLTGIGTTTPWGLLSVNANALGAGVPQFVVGSSTGTKLVVANGGNVGVGTTSPLSTFTVNGGVTLHGLAAGAGAGAVCATADGLISYNSAAACTTSSQRFKNSITPISSADALATILALQPVTFRYNQGQGDNGNNLWEGFIAEQVNTVDKNLVQYDPSGDGLPYSVYYQNITSKLTGAVQALAGRTDALSISTTTLGSRIGGIEAALAAQQAAQTQGAPVNATTLAANSITTKSLSIDGNAFATSFIAPATPITFTIASTTGTLPGEVLTDDGGVDLYKAATYAITGVQSLQAQTGVLASRLDAVELRVAMLEAEASSTPATGGALSFAGFQDLLGQIGVIIKDGIAHFSSLAFTNLIAAPQADGTSAVATSTIPMGDTQVAVVNSLAHPTSKIFVTITSPLAGSWYISQKAEGSFTINLSSPQTSDVTFDYFIVQTEGNTQVASAGAAPNPGQISVGNAPAPGDPNASTTPPSVNAPTITLTGDAAVDIAQGAFWTDPGASAHDAAGNDLTAQIAVTGSVDTNTAGLYTLNYSVVDAAGASAGVSRIVHVSAPTLSSPPADSGTPPAPPADATPPPATPAPVISGDPAPSTGG